jgi:hypothetical protein
VPGIGRSPFDLVSTSRETVGWAEADWNGHMSNSCAGFCYSQAGLRRLG